MTKKCGKCGYEPAGGVDRHDCRYVRAVDDLIPLAEAEAGDATAGQTFSEYEQYAAAWNAVFHAVMGRLTREAGLRR